MIYDYIVIGAGLSGLWTASQLSKNASVLILEKSRGVGGRMATRRALETKFDHGAQFYRLNNDILNLHQIWIENNKVQNWFNLADAEHWCSSEGITSLAKVLANNLKINLEKQISSINYAEGKWNLISDKGEQWNCHNLILSSPLPQSIKLLENYLNYPHFNIKRYEELKKLHYTKAIILLLTLKENININESGYLEFSSGDIYSIADQKQKKISSIPAYTITMSAKFSEENFELSEDEIKNKIINSISSLNFKFSIKENELKKWRYCKPFNQDNDLFCEIAQNLYLIGDSFGGGSLMGAARSSNALVNHLKKNELY